MIAIIFIIFYGCMFIVIGLLIYFAYRNGLVYEFRRKLIYENPKAYSELPEYEEMIYSFKPLKSFIKK